MKLDGFVIVPPLSPWDEKHEDEIIPDMSYHNFGKTATEAWLRHMQTKNDLDFSRKVQYWHDRGYRLKRATLTIQMENDDEIGKEAS